MGIVQMNGLTRVVLWWLEARKRLRTFLSSSTCTSNVKYFFNYRQKQEWLATTDRTDRQKAYVLDDHDEEGEFDSKGFLGVDRAGDVVG